MDRRAFLKYSGGAALLSLTGCGRLFSRQKQDTRSPNVVIIFTDDQGYSDVGCFGAKGFKTPHIDQMAAEGVKFTDFYVAACVCTPSRSALMTGCYPKRVGLHVSVLFPQSDTGLNPDEITIADMLKSKGYATGCFGKWHLGHHTKFLPTRQGFDTYFGLPYSNDMSRNYLKKPTYPKLPLMRQEEVIEYEPDQNLLTRRYTNEACEFIRKNANQPFFVYLPHSMPHIPIHASEPFRNKAEYGLYGDVIQEIDESVGDILKTLKETGNDKNTLLFFCSDNGPVVWPKKKLGSCRPLRGSKATTWEGGQREPTILWWPGKIPAGKTCKEVATTMDILPTIAHITGIQPPRDRIIDGKNIWNLITHPETGKSAHDAFYYYGRTGEIEAVRCGKWKLHTAKHRGWDEKTQGPFVPFLVDLEKDIGETTNVADEHPDLVKKLTGMMTDFDAELTQTTRPVGTL